MKLYVKYLAVDIMKTPINFGLKNLTNNHRKAAQYELTSPIFIMEQYIPLSLKCESSSRILEKSISTWKL